MMYDDDDDANSMSLIFVVVSCCVPTQMQSQGGRSLQVSRPAVLCLLDPTSTAKLLYACKRVRSKAYRKMLRAKIKWIKIPGLPLVCCKLNTILALRSVVNLACSM